MSQEKDLLKALLETNKAMLEELTLLRESQKPSTFPLVDSWKVWIKNRNVGPQKAQEEARKKQHADNQRLAQAVGANLSSAKIIHQDPNENIDREAPAFLEVIS